MIDIFIQKDVAKLLRNKTIVFMGDSNIRALYKDLLCLFQQTKFISEKALKKKMEDSCFGDKLLTNGPKTNGRSYREERLAYVNNSKISYYFLTCVYDKYVEEVLHYISDRSNLPDVLIINSVLWDVTRWGPNGVEHFKKNLVKLMQELKRLVPNCLVIWVTAPPIAGEVKGGFLVKELEFLKYSLRFHVMEANYYARKVVVNYGFDVVDSHYHLKMQLHRRSGDGIHWMPDSVRYVTNLLLTHISIAWNVPLPQRYKSNTMEETLEYSPERTSEYNDIKNEPNLKIASVIEKPAKSIIHSPEEVCKIKKEKENTNSKTPQKKRKRSRKKRNVQFQESHHVYLSRAKKQERSKRIRRWKSSVPESTPTTVERVQDSADDNILFDNQQDSGYFPSPQNTSLLGTPHFHYDKPVYYSNSCHQSLYSNPYPYQDIFTKSSIPDYHSHNSRRVIISSDPRYQPYIFPNINTQNFQPIINFTHNVPFGFTFK